MPYDLQAFYRSGLESAQATQLFQPQTEALKSQYELTASQNKSTMDSKSYLDSIMKQVSQEDSPGVPGIAKSDVPGETAGTPSAIKLGPEGFGGTPAPKDGLTGLGGMQQGISGTTPKPEAPKETAPVVQRLNEAKENLTNSQKIMKTYEKAISQAMRDGKSDVVTSLNKQLNEQKEAEYKAQKLQLDASKEVLEIGGKIGTGYLDAVAAAPSEEPMAWAQFIMQAQKNGFPSEQLMKAQTPEQHKALATQLKGLGEKSSDAIRLKIAEMNNARQTLKDAAMNDWKSKNYKYKETNDAANREFKETKDTLDRKEKLDKDHFDNLHKIVSSGQTDRTGFDNQIKQLELEKTDLSSLKDLMGPNGKAYTAEERADRLSVVEAQINDTKDLRDQNETRIREGESLLREAGQKPPVAPKPTPVAKVAPEHKEVYDQALAAIKAGAPRAAVAAKYKATTGVDMPDAPGASPKPVDKKAVAPLVYSGETAKVKAIKSQEDLDRAIRSHSLTIEEIKMAKDKVKSISGATHWWN